ncbi:hypothetical protein CC79DRAFT_433368 [Sarocladium strictum]
MRCRWSALMFCAASQPKMSGRGYWPIDSRSCSSSTACDESHMIRTLVKSIVEWEAKAYECRALATVWPRVCIVSEHPSSRTWETAHPSGGRRRRVASWVPIHGTKDGSTLVPYRPGESVLREATHRFVSHCCPVKGSQAWWLFRGCMEWGEAT